MFEEKKERKKRGEKSSIGIIRRDRIRSRSHPWLETPTTPLQNRFYFGRARVESGLGRNESEPFACAPFGMRNGGPLVRRYRSKGSSKFILSRTRGRRRRDEIICPGKKWQG